MRRQPGLVIGFGIAAVLAIVIGGLGATLVRQSDAVPTPTLSPAAVVASASPLTPSIDPVATSASPGRASPSPKPADRPKPSAIAAAKWRKPQQVERADCESVAAVIDGAGGSHVASGCRGEIHAMDLDTDDWDPVKFKPPEARQEFGPQLAVDGDVLYLAYTRVAIDEGACGDDGLRDVGVYYRTRDLSAGRAWSDPRRIGEIGDSLHALRVVGGTIHAAVGTSDGKRFFYETVRGGSYHRYQIPKATGTASLRIGDDGRARIAYEAGGSLRYGTFTGAGFSSRKIPGTSRGYSPMLVLGANDQPHLMWFRGNKPGGGCAEPDPLPKDGTYYSTLKGGTWRSERLVASQYVAAVTVDTISGRLHVLVSGKGGRLVYLTKVGSGAWSKRIVDSAIAGPAVIRLDQPTGRVLVMYLRFTDEQNRPFMVAKR